MKLVWTCGFGLEVRAWTMVVCERRCVVSHGTAVGLALCVCILKQIVESRYVLIDFPSQDTDACET